MPMGFADYVAWNTFNENFSSFVETYQHLDDLLKKVFVRRVEPVARVDWVVFGLGRICMEDFQATLCLCGNGFGINALQLVRGMYERQVTASYLSTHPDEVDQFLNYYFVQRRKGMKNLEEAYRGDKPGFDELIPPDRQDAIEQEFQNVRETFTQPYCECGRTRLMISWSKHHTGVLARKGGQDLHHLYYYQYLRPTDLSHSTVAALRARIVDKNDGGFSFEAEGQRKHVKEALVSGHNLILNTIDLQNKHFQLDVQQDLDQCFEDYKSCWVRRNDE